MQNIKTYDYTYNSIDYIIQFELQKETTGITDVLLIEMNSKIMAAHPKLSPPSEIHFYRRKKHLISSFFFFFFGIRKPEVKRAGCQSVLYFMEE